MADKLCFSLINIKVLKFNPNVQLDITGCIKMPK